MNRELFTENLKANNIMNEFILEEAVSLIYRLAILKKTQQQIKSLTSPRSAIYAAF